MPDKKVLITGSSGLIGGLVLAGLSEKYEFSGLSRRPTPGIPHTMTSITDAEAIRPAFEGIDTVLHLAAGTSGTTESWDIQMSLTAQGTLNVFEAAREADVKRVVFMSAGSTMMGWQRDESMPYGAMWRGDYDSVPESWDYVDYTWAPRPRVTSRSHRRVRTPGKARWTSYSTFSVPMPSMRMRGLPH